MSDTIWFRVTEGDKEEYEKARKRLEESLTPEDYD